MGQEDKKEPRRSYCQQKCLAQGGRFDHADRLFSSVAGAWQSCLVNSSDVKELIPEFFYLPDFLNNADGFRLGHRQVRSHAQSDQHSVCSQLESVSRVTALCLLQPALRYLHSIKLSCDLTCQALQRACSLLSSCSGMEGLCCPQVQACLAGWHCPERCGAAPLGKGQPGRICAPAAGGFGERSC